MPASDPQAPPPGRVANDVQDRLAALRNAAYIIRISSRPADPVIVAALRMIDQQVEHLSRWAEQLDLDAVADPG
jgi:hypothetical protein